MFYYIVNKTLWRVKLLGAGPGQTHQYSNKEQRRLESIVTKTSEGTMSKDTITSLEEHFGNMRDPRVVGRCDHKLMDIIIVAICAGLNGVWLSICSNTIRLRGA